MTKIKHTKVHFGDIITDVHREHSELLPNKADVATVVTAAFTAILDRLGKQQSVGIPSFGTFKTRVHKGREMTPPTGTTVAYGDSVVLAFKQSSNAKAFLNEALGITASEPEPEPEPKAKKAKAKAEPEPEPKAKKAKAKAEPEPEPKAKKPKAKPEPEPEPDDEDEVEDDDDDAEVEEEEAPKAKSKKSK